ncbi:LuxR C-terminal-related transcriptional regulator [Catellatospora methionotrophica]|uniref:LuxR C-terminal-related transcriptional regulator n=1 Tax=Catellatospora methionotrophica TaxID=121620 RepID=UPI0033D362CA
MTPVPMVGRAAELAELVRRWSHVRDGGPAPAAVVSITASAGIGKSRLVTSALAAFSPPPAAVLYGVARLHTPAPYDWLAAVLSGRDTRELPVPADGLAWLAQDPHAPSERYAPGALLRLAVRTVRALVGAGPAVLVVEDLHALDPASLNLVGELAAAPDLPALILATSRPPDAADSPELVARTLARLSGAPGAVRQHLGPLGPDDVAQIVTQVHGTVPEHLAGAVCERTGGNPYWLVELLAATVGRGPQALLDEPMPGHLRPGAGSAGRDVRESAELTAREREVLGCLAAGMSNKQMARTLDISIRTVAVHVSNLLRKTGSASRTEAALWAVRRG